MPLRFAVLLVPLVLACQFDPGAVSDGNGTEDRGEEGVNDPGRDTTPIIVALAIAEETRRGKLIGSLVDSHVLDGTSQTITGEISRGDERLEHTWYFDPVPAGTYSVVFVAAPSGLQFLEEITVEYETEAKGSRTDLLTLTAAQGEAEYRVEISLDEAAALEFKAKISKDTPANGTPTRMLSVDYLAVETASSSGN